MIEKQKYSILISQLVLVVLDMRVRSTDVQRYLRHFTLFYAYLASHLSLPAGPDDSGGKNVHDERLAPYSLTGVASVE